MAPLIRVAVRRRSIGCLRIGERWRRPTFSIEPNPGATHWPALLSCNCKDMWRRTSFSSKAPRSLSILPQTRDAGRSSPTDFTSCSANTRLVLMSSASPKRCCPGAHSRRCSPLIRPSRFRRAERRSDHRRFARRAERAPDRRVVGRLLFRARRLVDLAGLEPVRRLRAEHQVIDAQPLVAMPAPGLIVPEAVAMRLGMEGTERVDITEIGDGPEGETRFELT